MKKPKFIIVGTEFRMGWVELHYELAENKQGEIKGGGYWHFLDDGKMHLLLYGVSVDFGHVTQEQIIEVFTKGDLPPGIKSKVEKVFHSTEIKLENAKENKSLIMLMNGKSLM